MSSKEDYENLAAAKLESLQADLAKLQAKAKEQSAEGKIALNKQIESAKAAIDEGKQNLAKLTDASDDAWEEVKDSCDALWSRAEGFLNGLFSDDKKR